ncbi:hypothetical protein P7K49_034934 [Saguinus oedipus]|uniref:Uncharacterized protein n=1 Tax=Saguinus oedipus TaxID=9490 RepID=A0ABQ9TW51_SAGOE|nr:hypothetical protein P7K49_034934 [Saguinus oedipus]
MHPLALGSLQRVTGNGSPTSLPPGPAPSRAPSFTRAATHYLSSPACSLGCCVLGVFRSRKLLLRSARLTPFGAVGSRACGAGPGASDGANGARRRRRLRWRRWQQRREDGGSRLAESVGAAVGARGLVRCVRILLSIYADHVERDLDLGALCNLEP